MNRCEDGCISTLVRPRTLGRTFSELERPSPRLPPVGLIVIDRSTSNEDSFSMEYSSIETVTNYRFHVIVIENNDAVWIQKFRWNLVTME